jgi:glutaredoxin
MSRKLNPQIQKLLKEVEENNHKDVVVYSLKSCPSCIELKEKFGKINLTFEEVDMEGNDKMWSDLESMGGSEYVPQVEVDGYLIRKEEYEDVNELISKTLSNLVGRKVVIKN